MQRVVLRLREAGGTCPRSRWPRAWARPPGGAAASASPSWCAGAPAGSGSTPCPPGALCTTASESLSVACSQRLSSIYFPNRGIPGSEPGESRIRIAHQHPLGPGPPPPEEPQDLLALLVLQLVHEGEGNLRFRAGGPRSGGRPNAGTSPAGGSASSHIRPP